MEENISNALNSLRSLREDYLAKARKIESLMSDLEGIVKDMSERRPGEPLVAPIAPQVRRVPLPPPPRNGAYAGKTIGEAAVEFLRSVGSPQKTRTIATALENGGIHSSDMYRAVFNALDGNDMALKAIGKRWALKEWSES